MTQLHQVPTSRTRLHRHVVTSSLFGSIKLWQFFVQKPSCIIMLSLFVTQLWHGPQGSCQQSSKLLNEVSGCVLLCMSPVTRHVRDDPTICSLPCHTRTLPRFGWPSAPLVSLITKRKQRNSHRWSCRPTIPRIRLHVLHLWHLSLVHKTITYWQLAKINNAYSSAELCKTFSVGFRHCFTFSEHCTPSSSMAYMSACVTMMRREAPLSDQSPPSPQIRAKTLRGAAHNSSQLRRVTSVTPWHAVITQPGIDNHITREHAPAVLTKSGLNWPEMLWTGVLILILLQPSHW